MSETCYLVAHLQLIDGELVAVRVGNYSSPGYHLTNMGGEVNVDVLSVEAENYEKAREGVLRSLNYMADLGVPEWVRLRELCPDRGSLELAETGG